MDLFGVSCICTEFFSSGSIAFLKTVSAVNGTDINQYNAPGKSPCSKD